MEIRISRDSEQVAAAAADAIAGWLGGAPHPSLGLAGGTTPRATYEQLRDRDVEWEAVTAWLADERWVPRDHPDSNARMAREALFDHVQATLLEVRYELGDPHEAAASYESTLRTELMSLDVILLGLGTDGHTASLFPDTAFLEAGDAWYVANWVESQDAWRLTATYRLLWGADRVAFLVTGEAKAERVAATLERGEDNPASRVHLGGAEVVWFLDEAAASQLENR